MRVVSVSRTQFKTEDGQIFPIDPPLLEELTLGEFQKYYDRAAIFVESLQVAGNDIADPAAVGRGGKNQDGTESG